MSKNPKKEIYNQILQNKLFLTVSKNLGFSFEIPKKAFDRICQFYGKETLTPTSFILFNNSVETVEFKKMSTVSHVLGENEITNIFDYLNNFIIIPKNFQEKDEVEKLKLAPKIDNKAMRNIMKKAGFPWGMLNDYCTIQQVSTEVEESSQKIITYAIVENVFKYIPLLNIKMVNGEKIDFTFYSYRKILEKSGLPLEKMIPYLHHEIKDIDRTELLNSNIPLYESVKTREKKERMKFGDLKDQNVQILLGAEQCRRFKEIDFDIFQNEMEQASDCLNDLIEKVNNKKNTIKKYYENKDNHIIEIKDINNKNIYIRKKIYDAIKKDGDSEFDKYKTNDVYGNEITLSKKDLSNYESSPSLVKIYNKKNPKEQFIFHEVKDIEKKLGKFKYINQEETFKGKNKNEEPVEEQWLIMDLECDDLPILDESKPLYSIPEKEDLFEKTKNDLLDELKKDNKDILLYNKNNNFIPVNLVKEIKERDKKIKNKNIKYTIKNQVNKKEKNIVDYKDIFNDDNSNEYILINDESNPEENLVVNKKDLSDALNNWDNLNNNIIINNEVNNNKIEINPTKIKIMKLEKDEIPKNYEDIQEEIKNSITPENTIIKSNDNLIKKSIVQKIINNNDPEYDEYYIKDINGQKIKVSKKQLEKDNEDPSLQFISIPSEEDPTKNLIIPNQEIIKQIELDPMDESCSINDVDGKKHTLKKTSIKINPLEIEEINFDEQPNKIKNNIIKDIKDYYYIYKDPENKPHYIRGDILKLIKNNKSPYPIENFEVEDNKENKFIIPKESAIKLIDDPNEIKYISLDDEESNGEPIMADFEMFKKVEGDIDEPLSVNKDGKKIKLKNIKLTKLKEIDSLEEQPEEKKYETINNLIKILQKNNPSNNIYKVKDNENKDIFIYEDTLNKIEENKTDPEKTTYKVKSPLNKEIICGKNVTKSSPNSFIRLVEPNNILDKNELEQSLKEYKPSQGTIKMKDAEGTPIEFDPLKAEIYEPSPDNVEITKILPADFSDINDKLLIDVTPQNKLILMNDSNNQPILIKKKEGDSLVKYPKTTFDNYALYDKDGKKVKVSRKNVEKNINDNNCEYIEILDNTNGENKNEIVLVKELLESLKDKENEDFDIKNKDGKKIKLNKKKITIVKQNNKYIDMPEQGEEIKNKLLSEITDSFIKLKDSKNNKDILLRSSQIDEINNHKQKAPFTNYEVLDNKKEKVYTTKDICGRKISAPNNEKLILCYDETQKDKEFFVPLENIQSSNLDADDEFEISNNQKIIFKNLKVKKMKDAPKLGTQPEEEKMIKINDLIKKFNEGALNKYYKTKDIQGKTCFISNEYINKLKNESKNDGKDTKYEINDVFGKNKITITKTNIDKDKSPEEYVLIKNIKDKKEYLVDLNDLLNNLKKYKSNDDSIKITNSVDNKSIEINPLDIEIIPPSNNYPFKKIEGKEEIPIIDNNKDDNLNINNEKQKDEEDRKDRRTKEVDKDKEGIKERIRLRSTCAIHHNPEKKTYIIRRAIIKRKQKK